MRTESRRSVSSFIPGYHSNAVLQLIAASGVGFILFNFIRVLMLVFGNDAAQALNITVPYIALPQLHFFAQKWWTLFTYGWSHMGFWEWLSNMFWLYCFGTVVQSLIGHKQIIPIFIYSLLLGGIFYLIGQFIPGDIFQAHTYLLGAQAGVMGLAIASLTLAPKYRYYIGPNFSVPIIAVVTIYAILNLIVYIPAQVPMLFLALGGGLSGFLYIKLLRSGYRVGEWAYDLFARMERTVTPDEHKLWQKNSKKRNDVLNKVYTPKKGISQQRIDTILDKINQQGYESLTIDEKDALLQASREND
ncbi:MAG: rhomboid family intramembrane serine protease [Bacteroidota bacterium]